MSNAGFATLDVIPSMKGFQGHLEKGTRPGLLSAGKSGGTLFGDTAGRSAGQRFGSVFKSAAKAGILGGLAIAAGAIKLGVDALGEASEAQKVGRQTAAVIKSTGGAAKVSQADVGKLANQLSYMAGVDDELVQSSANVLLTFKGIRNEAGKNNRIFDRGAKVALNMSKAPGTDLKGASIQVGKALNDPVKGITALQRVGVSFTKQQKAQITALVEGGTANAAMALGLIDSTTQYNALLKEQDGDVSKVVDGLTKGLTPAQKKVFDTYEEGGHTLEAQKRILKELGSEFGGSARSQATAADRLKVAFGNVEEKIGKGLLPIVQDLQRFLLRKGIPAIDDFATWFKKDGANAIQDFIDKSKPVAEKWLPKIADGFQTAGDYAKTAAGFAADVVGAFDDLPPWVKKALTIGAAGGLTAKKLGLTKALGSTGLFSKGGTPVNPLFVSVVNDGVGTGGGSKGGLLNTGLKALGTASLVGGIAAGITAGVSKALGKGNQALLGAGSGGTGGLPEGSHFFDLDDDKVKAYNKQLSKTQSLWVDARLASQDYAFQVKNGIPRSALTTVTNWPLWNAKAKEYLATILLIRDQHMDTRLDRAGGSGPAGSGFDPSNGTRPHGRPRGDGGVNFTGPITVETQNVDKFLTDLQGRAWRASAGGSQ